MVLFMWTSSALCENFLGFVESFSLTAAFDTVDYNILLSRHKHAVGFKGTVLLQFKSWQRGLFLLQLGSTPLLLSLLVVMYHRGLLWSAMLSLHMLPLGTIFRKYNIPSHCYAIDIQIYFLMKWDASVTLQPLFICLHDS